MNPDPHEQVNIVPPYRLHQVNRPTGNEERTTQKMRGRCLPSNHSVVQIGDSIQCVQNALSDVIHVKPSLAKVEIVHEDIQLTTAKWSTENLSGLPPNQLLVARSIRRAKGLGLAGNNESVFGIPAYTTCHANPESAVS